MDGYIEGPPIGWRGTLFVLLGVLIICGVPIGMVVKSMPDVGVAASDFPDAPDDETGGPAPIGHVAYQLPIVPITFSIDTKGKVRISVSTGVVTPLGSVRIGGGVVLNARTIGLLEKSPLTSLSSSYATKTIRTAKPTRLGQGESYDWT